MLRGSFLLALLLVVPVPSAQAFSSTPQELVIAYAADATPPVVSTGATSLRGTLTGSLFVGGSSATRLLAVPTLTLLERGPNGTRVATTHDATLELHEGALLLAQRGGTLVLDVASPYAIGLALPASPLPSEGASTAGFLLAGDELAGSFEWTGGPLELKPFDAVLTIRDSHGKPLPDWEARHVNAGARSLTRDADVTLTFRAEGPFRGLIQGVVLGGSTGDDVGLQLRVRPADEDGFAAALDLLDATQFVGAEAPAFGGQGGPLAWLKQASGILNGALVMVAGDGTTAPATPVESRWGGDAFELGAITIVRGDDIGLHWKEGQMRVQGEPALVLGRDGFASQEPARVGIFPIASLVLWLAAAGATVYFVLRQPLRARTDLKLRASAFLVYVLALLGALYLWDRSFTESFGTGVVEVIRHEGLSVATLPKLGVLAAFEMIPWGIAALLFALPARIALGIALRYLGRGKSFKGLASAGGLVVLALLGPLYALYCFNLVWQRVGGSLGG